MDCLFFAITVVPWRGLLGQWFRSSVLTALLRWTAAAPAVPWRRHEAPTIPSRGHTAPPNRARHPRAKPDWVHREVIRLAVFLRGCRSIATTFNALHGQRATVGHDFVARVLRLHADEIAARRRGMRGAVPHAHRVGDAVAMDLTGVLVGSQRFQVLGLIDRGSRRMLRLRTLVHKCTWSLLGHLCLAIAEHGRPTTLRTDNEAMFTSWLWRTALRCMGIRHQRTRVASPWQNGCIERFWGSLKPVLGKLSLNSAQMLQASLDEFALFYNHVRPHQALGGLTPFEAWNGVVIDDVRRCAGRGRWVQACDGQLIGYHLRL